MKHRNVTFGQESLNQMLRLVGVMKKMLILCSPRTPSFSSDSTIKAANDFRVAFRLNVLTVWCALMMHYSTGVNDNHQHGFDVCYFVFRDSMLSFEQPRMSCWTSAWIFFCSIFRNFGKTFANIRRIAEPSLKWIVSNHYLFRSRPHFFG